MLPAIPELRQLRYFVDGRRREALRARGRASLHDAAAAVAGHPGARRDAGRRVVRAHQAFGRADAGGRRSAARSAAPAGERRKRCGRSRRVLRAARRGSCRWLLFPLPITACCRCCCAISARVIRACGCELTEATSDVQVDELVAGRIDAGLVIAPLPPRHASQLSWLPIAREPLVIAMSSGDGGARGERRRRHAEPAPNGSTRRSACATSPTHRS